MTASLVSESAGNTADSGHQPSLYEQFGPDVFGLLTQYLNDIAMFGSSGWVLCSACGDRLMPTAHVVDRYNELYELAGRPDLFVRLHDAH